LAGHDPAVVVSDLSVDRAAPIVELSHPGSPLCGKIALMELGKPPPHTASTNAAPPMNAATVLTLENTYRFYQAD
jgi:hypothetical protein